MRTARLGFGHWSDGDWTLALSLWGDPAVTRYTAVGGVLSQEQIRDRLDRELRTRLGAGVQYWPLFRLDDGIFVGCCGLKPKLDAGPAAGEPETGVLELGFQILPRFWGLGYATEAAAAVVAHAFGGCGAAALFAGHHPDNAASRRVLEKLGFRYTHVEHFPGTGLSHVSYRLDAAHPRA